MYDVLLETGKLEFKLIDEKTVISRGFVEWSALLNSTDEYLATERSHRYLRIFIDAYMALATKLITTTNSHFKTVELNEWNNKTVRSCIHHYTFNHEDWNACAQRIKFSLKM